MHSVPMPKVAEIAACDHDLIGLMDRLAGGVLTLGGAARCGGDVDMGRSDRVAGVGAGGDLHSAAEWLAAGTGVASLSGAAVRSERPEAMLARGSRVTGSGGAAWSAASSAEPTGDFPPDEILSFVALTDFRPELIF